MERLTPLEKERKRRFLRWIKEAGIYIQFCHVFDKWSSMSIEEREAECSPQSKESPFYAFNINQLIKRVDPRSNILEYAFIWDWAETVGSITSDEWFNLSEKSRI